MRIVGCFLEYDTKFVVLYRHSHKPDGDTWGLPSGKVEPGEKDDDAILRELYEETGYKADRSELELLGVFDFTSPSDSTNNFVTYRVKLNQPHQMILEESAHAKYRWVTAEECDALPDLIYGVSELLRMVGYIKSPVGIKRTNTSHRYPVVGRDNRIDLEKYTIHVYGRDIIDYEKLRADDPKLYKKIIDNEAAEDLEDAAGLE